jgi:RHS repeat-associated protein
VYDTVTIEKLAGSGGREDLIYYYHGNHLSSTQTITDGWGYAVQQVLYAPFGEVVKERNQNWNNNVPAYLFNAKELDEESGMYYFEARYMKPPVFISRDPLFEAKPWMSGYAYCSNSPVNRVDPSGLADDWYENETGTITWTDHKSQKEMDDNGVKGRYLGQAVVVFEGSRDEQLGEGDNLLGEGAVLAKATVYGPKNAEDIAEYGAFTMSSDYSKYGAIDDGEYVVNYRDPGKGGALKSNWAVNDTKFVDALDGYNPNPARHSKTQKNGVYIHSSNKNGGMLPRDKNGLAHPVSTGCPIILPSGHGQNGWNEFNGQLKGVNKFIMIMTGRRKKD